MLNFGLNVLAFINRLKHQENPLAILYFHRVLDQADPFCPDDLDISQFDALLTKLNQHFCIMPLTEAFEKQAAGQLPAKALAITFDDGYTDNFTNALPIFDKLNLKGSFFIATQGTEQGYLWSDKLAFSLANTTATQFGIFDLAFVLKTRQEKADAYLTLVNRIKFMSNQARDEALVEIYSKIGEFEPPRCVMTAEQIKQLDELGHDVGAHTYSHSILAKQTDDVAREEMNKSISDLAEILDKKPTLFAYPNGWYGRDFDQRHEQMLRELNVEYGLATNDGGVTSITARTAIPRFMPHRKEFNQFCLSIQKIAGEK